MAVGVVVIPLSDPEGDFGWSMITIGAALMMYYLVGAVISPMIGWLGDRYGPRRMMLVGGILYAGSMALAGIISQPWQFFLAFSFLLALTQVICMVPLMAAVSGWFRRRLGVGVGLLWAAGGIGTAILAPLLGFLIDRIGWRGGYVNRCVNDIRRRPSQPLIQWRFHPHTVHRDRRLRSTQGPSDA